MTDLTLGYLVVSLLAGMLTVLQPCVLPLLPLIVGGIDDRRSLARPLAIILSLGASIIIFTLLLKASTALLGVPDAFWRWFSGGILLVFGLSIMLPAVWVWLIAKLRFKSQAQQLLGSGLTRGGWGGYSVVGFALGPIFFSCSPTYAAIVAVALPASPGVGLVYLLVYVLGLIGVLFLISLGGQVIAGKLGFLSNPKGWFMRSIGILMIVTGLAILPSVSIGGFRLTGFYRDIEVWLIERGVYDPVINLEQNLGPGEPARPES